MSLANTAGKLAFAIAAFSPSFFLSQEAGNGISADRYALKVKKAPALQEGLFTYTVCLQLPEGDREKFLEQLEIVAQACRAVSNPQR